ncbi:hypothetical protein ASG35_16270 [Burkholderia sp. Leaf177]|uniref:DUF4365 domain-containing protein n=1 Tax=Burkholderia sp. Leaf177 TaxID=1736287 RepID=UPI0006FC2C70|nr:DUF4365 domain-containing protein [Burkholderia sp. Leaf177]KQR76590.1 hypothetical protein ASG35_16270 [Burkholderia sp. Leaf177]
MAIALSTLNRESELSYAYLHAIASHAGVNCKISNRHDDNAGIDAILTGWEPFPNGGALTEVDIKVQLKATVKVPFDDGESLSYFLSGTQQYDALRRETHASPRILAVLFLPPNAEDWLEHSEEQLVLRKCAYWVSLRGAPATNNTAGVTVKIPKKQTFDGVGLMHLMASISRREIPAYPSLTDRVSHDA